MAAESLPPDLQNFIRAYEGEENAYALATAIMRCRSVSSKGFLELRLRSLTRKLLDPQYEQIGKYTAHSLDEVCDHITVNAEPGVELPGLTNQIDDMYTFKGTYRELIAVINDLRVSQVGEKSSWAPIYDSR
jgi:hypothetical protein